MIGVDSSVVVELLSDSPRADSAEATLRECLARGPVVVCDVAVAEICSALADGAQALQALEELGIAYSAIEAKAALRAGEMHRRWRSRHTGVERVRSLQDFLIGAHALLQCDGLVSRDAAFFKDYFKGLKVIAPKAA